VVQWGDFQKALDEVEPRLGANAEELQTLFRNGIVPYGPSFDNLMATLRRFVQQVRACVRAWILPSVLGFCADD
jgi:hypothetical protein